MSKVININSYRWLTVAILTLGLSGLARAADVYQLQVGLYAVICEDGQIFSYSGGEDGLDIVVPALCDGHGGVANPGGGGAAAADASVARRPPSGRPDTGSSAAVSDRREVSRSSGGGAGGGRVSLVEIDRASPLLMRAMERCDTGSGARRVRAGNVSAIQCPFQSDQLEEVAEESSRR